jgi:hypothetical protein
MTDAGYETGVARADPPEDCDCRAFWYDEFPLMIAWALER